MSEHTDLLSQGIAAAVEEAPRGPVMLVGPPPPLAEFVSRRIRRQPVLVASRLKPWRLRGLRGKVVVLRSGSLELPAAARCLAAVVAVGQLRRLRSPRALPRAVEHWRDTLAGGGRIVLAEALGLRPPILRRRPCPEDLCGALLNAGFVGVRQTWTRPRGGFVITWGTLADL